MQTFRVDDMTCGHCAAAVSTEIGKLPGVQDVSVDVPTGQVTVSSEAPLDRAAVREAVDEAGYELVDV